MAKKLPVTESRIEQKAKRQRELETNDKRLPSRIEDQQWRYISVAAVHIQMGYIIS